VLLQPLAAWVKRASTVAECVVDQAIMLVMHHRLCLQVCCLDLSSISSSRTPSFKFGTQQARSRPTPSWRVLQAQGMLPSARTAAATAVLGKQLLLHGGMLCSKSVAGRLAADTFCLDMQTWAWTRLAPSQERAVGGISINAPRASHCAVAVPSAAAVMLIGMRRMLPRNGPAGLYICGLCQHNCMLEASWPLARTEAKLQALHTTHQGL
jgi:hypothetical protein